MIRAFIIACELKRELADALNWASGQIYTRVMVEHYRVYRKHGVWLRQAAAEKLDDRYHIAEPPLLHSHSIDAAQQGFYEACKTAKALKKTGDEKARYPHWRKTFRSTTWKKSGIRVQAETLILALARGREPIRVALPEALRQQAIAQVELVYNTAARHYQWHITTDDGVVPEPATGTNVLAGDFGEIHPCALSDGQETLIITNRELRATKQYTNKRLASLRAKQSHFRKGSGRWWRLQQRINRTLAKQQKKVRDLLHKTSRAIVDVAVEKQAKTLALGDVRDIADGKRLNTAAQQKVSQWSHGQLRAYITYKAEALGIEVVDDVNEAYSSQTCPTCHNRYKPRGRVYHCSVCGLRAHRDGVGAVNILSNFLHGEVGLIRIPFRTKYRIPFNRRVMRSPSDTGQMARNTAASSSQRELQTLDRVAQEATRL